MASFENPLNMGADNAKLQDLKNELAQLGEGLAKVSLENFTGKCPECGTHVEDTVDEYCLNCGASFDENDNVSNDGESKAKEVKVVLKSGEWELVDDSFLDTYLALTDTSQIDHIEEEHGEALEECKICGGYHADPDNHIDESGDDYRKDGEAMYGFGSATGRMSPRDSWEQGYVADGTLGGGKMNPIFHDFRTMHWSELPQDIQEAWKAQGDYYSTGENKKVKANEVGEGSSAKVWYAIDSNKARIRQFLDNETDAYDDLSEEDKLKVRRASGNAGVFESKANETESAQQAWNRIGFMERRQILSNAGISGVDPDTEFFNLSDRDRDNVSVALLAVADWRIEPVSQEAKANEEIEWDYHDELEAKGLVQCVDCDNEYNINAKSCPQCGKQNFFTMKHESRKIKGNEKMDKLSNVIDKINADNAPEGGWTDEDKVEEATGNPEYDNLDGAGKLGWIDNRMKQLNQQDPRTYDEWKSDRNYELGFEESFTGEADVNSDRYLSIVEDGSEFGKTTCKLCGYDLNPSEYDGGESGVWDFEEHLVKNHGFSRGEMGQLTEANLIPMDDADMELGDDPSKRYDDDGNEITESKKKAREEGTSAGAKKGWDTRGRGGATDEPKKDFVKIDWAGQVGAQQSEDIQNKALDLMNFGSDLEEKYGEGSSEVTDGLIEKFGTLTFPQGVVDILEDENYHSLNRLVGSDAPIDNTPEPTPEPKPTRAPEPEPTESEKDKEFYKQRSKDTLTTLNQSTVNGFPFFAYAGRPKYLMEDGKGGIVMAGMKRNPNSIGKVHIKYDEGRDTYSIDFMSNRGKEKGSLDDVYFDQLTDIIVDKMGIR